jgi:hypothetical protein
MRCGRRLSGIEMHLHFTKEALAAAWARHGFKNASLNDNLHVAHRTLPE